MANIRKIDGFPPKQSVHSYLHFLRIAYASVTRKLQAQCICLYVILQACRGRLLLTIFWIFYKEKWLVLSLASVFFIL